MAIEEQTLGRSGVLDYVDESDLRDIDLETAMEEFETYDSKEQEMPGHVW